MKLLFNVKVLTCHRGCHTMTTNAPGQPELIMDRAHLEYVCAVDRVEKKLWADGR